ncbi:MAG: UDP-N-acetylglucosamine 2-epimerase, partial [Candidatus Zipacnadales bacterium]
MDSATVALVFGTRPEAIKIGPVFQQLMSEGSPLRPRVIVTGQHRTLLDQMLTVFGMQPAHDLAVMSENQTPASLTGDLVPRLVDVFRAEQPDIVLVQG